MQVFFRRRDRLVVIRAVVPSAAIPLRAMACEFLLDVAPAGGLHEQEVFEQVRHSGFAVPFMPRAYKIGHVNRDLWIRWIGKQDHSQAVGIRVFSETLD